TGKPRQTGVEQAGGSSSAAESGLTAQIRHYTLPHGVSRHDTVTLLTSAARSCRSPRSATERGHDSAKSCEEPATTRISAGLLVASVRVGDMTRVFVGGYGGLAVGEFADRLIGLAPWGASGGAQPVHRPSYVVVSRDRRWVYAVSEGAEGKVVALPADGQGQLARVRSGGADPCHLALSPAGDLLVVSNYSSGTVGLLSVDGGTLTLQDTVHLTGHG